MERKFFPKAWDLTTSHLNERKMTLTFFLPRSCNRATILSISDITTDIILIARSRKESYQVNLLRNSCLKLYSEIYICRVYFAKRSTGLCFGFWEFSVISKRVITLARLKDWFCLTYRWVKVFKNGPSKICGRQPLKIFTWYILKYFDPNVLNRITALKFLKLVSKITIMRIGITCKKTVLLKFHWAWHDFEVDYNSL